MQPLVSVIINCYNSDEYLKKAIDSCYSQTYSNWEIIFFDNASTDNSKSIALSYNEKLKYHYSEKKLKLGEARNIAIKLAKGDYLCFLDCDDVYLNNKIIDQVRYMEEKNLLFSYSDYHVINENDAIIRSYRNKLKEGYLINNLLLKYEINFQSSMFKKTLFSNNEYFFDKNLVYSPDYNLIMRIALHNKIGILNKFTVNYRVHPKANSKKQLRYVSKEIKYTLDLLVDADKNHIKNYIVPYSINFAYNKIEYYKAIYFISINDYNHARNLLKKVKFKSLKFFLLLIMCNLYIPSSIILKLLRR